MNYGTGIAPLTPPAPSRETIPRMSRSAGGSRTVPAFRGERPLRILNSAHEDTNHALSSR
jgi:hypothetical protein